MGDKIHTRIIVFVIRNQHILRNKVFLKCFVFKNRKSLSTIYCLEMHMFSVWYVPMHLCGVALVCGSLVTENVWNKIFTIKSTRTESYYNTCTLNYLYSICLIYPKKNQQKNKYVTCQTLLLIVKQIPGTIFQGGGLRSTTFVIIHQNVRLGL